MVQKIDERVSVSLTYDSKKNSAKPRAVVWRGKLYPILKIGFHHTYRQGLTLYHVFSVTTPTLFLRLVLDTESLHWKLEEIYEN
jgi:hypothetical protein